MAEAHPPAQTHDHPRGPGGLVARNAAWLAAAQVAAAPLSIVVSGAMARYLGAADFGWIFLAATLCSFGFLLVDFGQGTALPGLVARERGAAGALVGTSLVWRAGAALAVWAVLSAAGQALGFGPALQTALALTALAYGLGAGAAAIQDGVRGFERTDVAAMGVVGQQLLGVALVLPALVLGGGLPGVLGAQVVAAAAALGVMALLLRPLGIRGLAFRRASLGLLLSQGSPFLLLGLALALQTNVDAVLLARLGSPEAVGWQAAARKLVGALLFPANALITALYPTLSRLWAQDRDAYLATARGGLRTAAQVAVPAALGCALFPDLGVLVFGRAGFSPAEDNLRVLAPFVLLVYGSMALGCCLSAAGRARAWALGQLLCVAVSATLDPLLIPWFQARGNGGLGVCVATVASEVLMLGVALWLVPRGVVGRPLLAPLWRAGAAGAAMAAVGLLLGRAGPFVAAPAAVAAYAGSLWALGGLDPEQVAGLKALVRRRG